MGTLTKALVILGGFMAGVVASFFACMLYVGLTYHCQEGPPCDAGGYVGFGMWLVSAPFAGAIFAYASYRLTARYNKLPAD